jgi:hypothetical protein
MASLFFTCPTTHQQAPTSIETDVQSLRAAWKATFNVKCPHCGEVHEISVRETYGHLEKFLSPSRHESDSVTVRGYGRMERAGHGAEGLFRC